MQVVGIAPIHDRIHQNVPAFVVETEIRENAPESFFVDPIDVDFAALIHQAHPKTSGAELLFVVITGEWVGLLGVGKLRRLRRPPLLVQKIVKTALEARERQIITEGLVTEALRRRRFFSRRRAEFEGDHEKKNKNP